MRESVRKDGGDPDKVKFVELAFDQMPAALDGGQVDAACAVEPALATIKSQGGQVIASPMVDVAQGTTVAMYFTSTRYQQQNADVVKKFQEATAESSPTRTPTRTRHARSSRRTPRSRRRCSRR